MCLMIPLHCFCLRSRTTLCFETLLCANNKPSISTPQDQMSHTGLGRERQLDILNDQNNPMVGKDYTMGGKKKSECGSALSWIKT